MSSGVVSVTCSSRYCPGRTRSRAVMAAPSRRKRNRGGASSTRTTSTRKMLGSKPTGRTTGSISARLGKRPRRCARWFQYSSSNAHLRSALLAIHCPEAGSSSTNKRLNLAKRPRRHTSAVVAAAPAPSQRCAQPALETLQRRQLGLLGGVNEVIGEVALPLLVRQPHQPAGREVGCDQRRRRQRNPETSQRRI